MKKFSIRHSKKILRKIASLYKRKRKNLSTQTQKEFEDTFLNIGSSINNNQKEQCSNLVHKLMDLADKHLKQTNFQKFVEYTFGILVALVIAIVIRQMWFEFYNIPSGSMRPTFKEKDYVFVAKNDFSLNVPLNNKHFYFNEKLLKRGNIIIFSGGGMDIPDVNTMYFFLFPGKKQYVKRMIAKPGDTIYFYGGKIYGIDSDGNKIKEYDQKLFEEIEHIPFINLDGKIIANDINLNGVFSPIYIYQMNEPVAKLTVSAYGGLNSEMLTENKIQKYSDLWGFKNYGTTRILTAEQVKDLSSISDIDTAPLYLEITHHPQIKPLQLIRDQYGRLRPGLSYSRSVIPLTEDHLKLIMEHISTSRFVVQNGKAYRYGSFPSSYSIPLSNVKDGIYEFDDGVLYKVQLDSIMLKAPNILKNIFNILPLGGFLKKMPKDHPLYNLNSENIQLLYNAGIQWNQLILPKSKNQFLTPSRYTYFRDGDLYLLGKPIYKKGDLVLSNFIKKEMERKTNSLSYEPFIDQGPPLIANKELDVEMIKEYGLKIPENGYLALGDNHANSSDSRDFGFVPQGNLKGSSGVIFWPPNRWGRPEQPYFPVLSFPKIFTWSIFAIIIIAMVIFYRKRKLY